MTASEAAAFTLTEANAEDDLDAVRSLCRAYRSFLVANAPRDREITETFYPVEAYEALMADLARVHARPAGIILLARDADGAPLGCGMTHALDPRTAEIKRVFVTDAARGRGVARRLCQALVDQARDDGYDRVVLDTSCRLTAAQSLYESLGFRRRGPYQPVPAEVLDDLVFYELAL